MSAASDLRSTAPHPSRNSRPPASNDAIAHLSALLHETVEVVAGLVAARTVLIALREERLWEVVAAVDRADIGIAPGVRSEHGMALWTGVIEQTLGIVPPDVAERLASEVATVEVAAIRTGDTVVGALAVLDREPVAVTADQAALLGLLARFVGHAYDDVWRHREAEIKHDLDAKRASDRRQLLSEVVHDLRTPLSVIVGMAEVIQTGRAGQEQRDTAARAISANARRLSTLVDGLLEAESPEELIAHEEVTEIDLRELVTDLAADTRQLLSRDGVGVTFYGGGMLRAQSDVVRRLVLNLAANAVKYTPRGRISIGAEEVAGGAVFTVSDTGRGMSSDDVRRFADAYVKGDDSEGFGLGLSIVRRLGDLLGARIEVDSEPGKGTRFRVFVPNRIS